MLAIEDRRVGDITVVKCRGRIVQGDECAVLQRTSHTTKPATQAGSSSIAFAPLWVRRSNDAPLNVRPAHESVERTRADRQDGWRARLEPR